MEKKKALSKILDERPGPERTALLLAEAAQKLSENLDALMALKDVGENARRKRVDEGTKDVARNG